MRRIPDGVRAVFFDAVGTLIHPEPSAADAYYQFGRQFGSHLPAGEVRRRFAAVFSAQERRDAGLGYRTDEDRERGRWRAIVAEVLSDVADQEGCFRALHDWFARPSAWRVEPGAGRVLRRLQSLGYAVGIASNFDRRLRGVVAGLDEVAWLRHLVISSEAGWRKPAPGFFDRLCRDVDLPPSRVLFVGDDLDNDYRGAVAAGLTALLFDPTSRSSLPVGDRLASLSDLLAES
jgi:putative hydrolase of the HAD superfamily